MKHLIIGGVAGGATAAARIRRTDENAEIILVEKGPYISYANCGLPYYLGGVITDRDQLFVQTPEAFGTRFRVDVRVLTEATAIDTQKKVVTLHRADGTNIEESYDKLLLSPGANPVRPALPGIDSPGIFTLRNVQDTDAIHAYMKEHDVKRAVIVGAGFIGLEMAENLHEAGAQVAIIEMQNQVMAPVDYSIASIAHEHLLQKGVKLCLEEAVSGFESTNEELIIKMKSGEQLEADLVILSIGVRPATQLAVGAGLKIGEAHGIWVNEYLETSAKDIYAVGDAIEFPHPITGQPWLNYLANPANRQGRIVADNMVHGNVTKYEGAIGTSIAKVFDMTVASTGLAAKKLKALGMPYKTITTHGGSHAGYYPGANQMTIKLIFHPETGRLLGGQIIGFDGVDKRIDQLAIHIKHGLTVYDLMELEHAYAPPFSSAKDPIAIAGYAAVNVLNKSMPVAYWREVQEIVGAYQAGLQTEDTPQLVDVRFDEEVNMGTLPRAIHVPLDGMRSQLDKIDKSKPVIVFCAVGLRGYLAQRILMGEGFQVRNLVGGLKIYKAATAPVVSDLTDWNQFTNEDGIVSEPVKLYNAKITSEDVETEMVLVDACGLQCPGPIMRVKHEMDALRAGQQLKVTSTDSAFYRDIDAWCDSTDNHVLDKKTNDGKYTAILEKGNCEEMKRNKDGLTLPANRTLVMFSDDLDKALATFVIANGAAATGQKVSIFFTFWGLNVIKKAKKPSVKKDIFGRMFGWMLPSHSRKLGMSKMNMFGMGPLMMRYIMKLRGVDELESLRQQALDNGVEFIACQMSMDVMGVKAEELMDEVNYGGVATYINRADKSNINLFI